MKRPREKEKRPREEKPPATKCEPDFLFNRRNGAFYRRYTNNLVAQQLPCAQSRKVPVPSRTSIPVLWANLAPGAANWDAASVKKRLDEAKAFFARYCIGLDLKPIAFRPAEVAAFARSFRRDLANADRLAALMSKATLIMRRRARNPKAFVALVFVGDFKRIRFDRRIDDVSGCFARFKCAVIQSVPDKRSTNIVTHELIHALGNIQGLGIKWAVPATPDIENTWNHGRCLREDMGNVPRMNPRNPVNLASSRLLDFAAYAQFTALSKTVR